MAGEREHILMELRHKVTVISQKETGEPSAPRPTYACCASGDSWLIAINAEAEKTMEGLRTRRKPKIQRAPPILRDAATNKSFFDPEVVSLGPYHHGGLRLGEMEKHKTVAAVKYSEGQGVPMGKLYDRVRRVTGKTRELYADAFDGLDNDAFANMMFLDGCFILHFIDCCVKKDAKSQSTSPPHLHGFVIRDMFLLENQVPFMVLEALTGPKHVDYEKFITTEIVGGKVTSAAGGDIHEEPPIHLLDLLRTRLLGRHAPSQGSSREGAWQYFRSVMELKEAGITFTKSLSSCLLDVTFKRGRVHGHLHLPKIVVDDLTRPRFLNLIALEMCPDSMYDYGVTTYVCFLDNLIDHAEDVKELRQKEILLNALGSDQQVADLFNELSTGLSPDVSTYRKAVMGIEDHYKNRWRVSVVRMLHTHFSSPWTAISFAAAVILLLLTVAQTFFAIAPKFAVDE